MCAKLILATPSAFSTLYMCVYKDWLSLDVPCCVFFRWCLHHNAEIAHPRGILSLIWVQIVDFYSYGMAVFNHDDPRLQNAANRVLPLCEEIKLPRFSLNLPFPSYPPSVSPFPGLAKYCTQMHILFIEYIGGRLFMLQPFSTERFELEKNFLDRGGFGKLLNLL